MLIHLVDATQEDVAGAWTTIRGELEAYGDELADKSEILALNKIDALDEETLAEKVAELEAVAGVKPEPWSPITIRAGSVSWTLSRPISWRATPGSRPWGPSR